jgi:two-component system NarL family sensor kinase
MTSLKTPGTVFLFLILVINFPACAFQQKDSADNHQKQVEKIIRLRADSIRKIVDRLGDDSTGVNALVQYAIILHITSLDSAYATLGKALSLAEKISFKKGTVRVLSQMGAVFQDRKDYPEAIRLYKQSYLIAEANNFTFETLQGYQRILNLYFYLGEFTEAMKLSTKGLAMGERSKNIRLEAYYVNLIGFIYLRQNNVEQADKYYSAYLRFGEQLGDSTIIGEAYNNLAEVFTAKKNHEVALDFLYRALNLYQRLHARKQLWKGDRLAYVTFRIGCNFRSQGNFPEALMYYLKAINYTKTTSCNKYDIASYYIYTGDCYRALGNPDKAVDYLEYGLAMAREIHHRENIRDACEFLALTYASRGQYEKAFRFHQLYDQLEDSIINEKSAREIEQVLATYSMEKKDREIEALQQQKKLSETEIQRQRLAGNAAIMLLVFSLILLYLLYTRYRLKQKNRFQTELNLQQNKMFNAIVSVQDKERKRIAQDIHDTLGSILSTAKLRLSGMEEYSDSMTDRQREQYVTIIGLLDEAVSELRNISHNIMPAALSRLGLVAALQNLFEKINAYSGIQIHYNVHGLSGRLEESTEITVYRIILELVNNVVKHAQASSLTVQLIQYTDHLNATVEDDGKGFEYDHVRKLKTGIGLNNIISRIGYLNGKIEIDTGPGKGTSIALDIPLGVNKL